MTKPDMVSFLGDFLGMSIGYWPRLIDIKKRELVKAALLDVGRLYITLFIILRKINSIYTSLLC